MSHGRIYAVSNMQPASRITIKQELFFLNKTRVSRFQTDLTTVNSGRIFYITHKQGREKKFHHFPQQQEECSFLSTSVLYDNLTCVCADFLVLSFSLFDVLYSWTIVQQQQQQVFM